VMKNALDWMVGNESFVAKPVALLNASPRASLAQAALRETLSTMSAHIVEAACVAVLLLGSGLSEDALVADPVLATVLRGSLAELRRAAAAQRAH
jgi:chromate reductase, NAD(P)H dehydrogenase (quinone)